MIIYIVIFIIASILMSMYLKSKEKRIFIILSAGILILFSGLRYYVGTDYNSYINSWYKLKDLNLLDSLSQSFEIINFLIIKITSIINSNDPQLYIFIYSLFTIIFVYKSLVTENKKLIPYYLLTYLTLFFSFSLNGIRQGLAIAIILYAFTYLKVNNKKKFLIFTLLAILVHNTAVIVLPFALYNNDKKKFKAIILIYAITTLIIIFGSSFLYNIPQLARYLEYFRIYSSSELGFGVLFKKAPLIILYCFFYKKLKEDNENTSLYFSILIVDLILSYLGYFSYYLNRISLYFSVMQVFAIPNMINIFKDRKQTLVKGIIICILFGVFIYESYFLNINEIIPYMSVIKL